jgi:uncharacterized membrane protein
MLMPVVGPAAHDGAESAELDAEVERISAERVIFFSDAVVAIAITLLALELPLPSGASNGDMLKSLNDNLDQYLAFLISFVVIAAHWRGHNQVFRYVDEIGPIQRWNMLWLLFIVITPFATRVLNTPGGYQVRFIMYAAVQVLAASSFLAILWGIQHYGLLRTGSPAGLVRTSAIRLAALAVTFLLSIPLAFVTRYAYYFWFAVPLFAVVARRIASLRSRRS